MLRPIIKFATRFPKTVIALWVIASLVLGILWIYWIGSVLALVFGYIARNQIRERGEGGDGLAIAGIVLGWIGVGVLALSLAVVGCTALLAASAGGS